MSSPTSSKSTTSAVAFAKEISTILDIPEDEIRDEVAKHGVVSLKAKMLSSLGLTDGLSSVSTFSDCESDGIDVLSGAGDDIEHLQSFKNPCEQEPSGYSHYIMPEGDCPDIQEMVVKADTSKWSHEDFEYGEDYKDWLSLTADERHFMSHILAFFAASDGFVNVYLIMNIISKVFNPEARDFYSIQFYMENVHAKTYRRLLESYIKDETKRMTFLNAITEMPAIKAKADLALEGMNADLSLGQIMFFFMLVELLMFMGSFLSIFWIKSRGLLHILTEANYLISRDEGLHTDFAVLMLMNHIHPKNRPSEKWAQEMTHRVVETEIEFLTEALPVKLIGMSSDMVVTFLRFEANKALIRTGNRPIYESVKPNRSIQDIWSPSQTNFFEKRTQEYNIKSKHMKDDRVYDSDDDEDY